MLLSEAFTYWLSVQKRHKATISTYRCCLIRLERIGFARLSDCTRERVVEAQARLLAEGRKPTGVRAQFSALRAVLAQLEEHGKFDTGTLAQLRRVAVPIPKQDQKRRVRHLSVREYEHLAATAAHVEPRLELPIRVAVLAGPRMCELARLRVADYDGRGSLHIETMPEFAEQGTCKTGPRVVPVCRPLAELLEGRLPRSGFLFPWVMLPVGGRPSKVPFLSRRVLERGIKKVRRAAGLPDDITMTVLRHTRASWWLQGGASIYKVADWLGHSVATCERYYGSLLDGYDSECERMPGFAA